MRAIHLVTLLTLLTSLTLLVGCRHTAEGVKADSQKALEKTGQGIEKAGQKTGEGLEKAGQKIENAGKK